MEVEFSDKELAYQAVELAIALCDNIVKEITTNLIDCAGSQLHSKLTSVDNLINAIESASDLIKQKIGRPGNFIIIPTFLARYIKSELITEYDFDSLPTNIRRVGHLRNKWSVYMNGYESNLILVGYRGEHPVDVGYIMSPRIMFCDPRKNAKTISIQKNVSNTFVKSEYYACIELTAANSEDSITAL